MSCKPLSYRKNVICVGLCLHLVDFYERDGSDFHTIRTATAHGRSAVSVFYMHEKFIEFVNSFFLFFAL